LRNEDLNMMQCLSALKFSGINLEK